MLGECIDGATASVPEAADTSARMEVFACDAPVTLCGANMDLKLAKR